MMKAQLLEQKVNEQEVVTKVIKKSVVKKNTITFAIISYLNMQFEVKIGSKILLPFNPHLKKDSIITFQQVLMVNGKVGTPYLRGISVLGKCLKPEIKDKKIIVFKYKAKKNYRVKKGHRQRYSLVEITTFQEQMIR